MSLDVRNSDYAWFCGSPRIVTVTGGTSTLLMPRDTTVLVTQTGASSNDTLYLPRVALAAGALITVVLVAAEAGKDCIIVPATKDTSINFFDPYSSAIASSIVLKVSEEMVTLFCTGRDWIIVRKGWTA